VTLSERAVVLPAPLLYRRTSEDPTAAFESMPTPDGVHRIGHAHGPIQSFSSTAAMNLIPADRAQRSGLDYLALGDWHGFTQIGERTAYSGTPEADDFDRPVTGGAVLVEIAAPGAVPALSHHPLGRFTWRNETWPIDGVSGLDGHLRGLRAQADLSRLVLRLKVSGIVSLADRVAMRERLESELGLETRWLDLDLQDLFAKPTEDDLGDIDAHGVPAGRRRTLAGHGQEFRPRGSACGRGARAPVRRKPAGRAHRRGRRMKIRSLALENFRRFRAPVRIEGLTDGLNLISEPNETGKSTILEAMRAALFERHGSAGAFIKSLRPWGDETAPTVELCFELDDASWTVSKRFLQKPHVSLTGPGGQVFTSDAAEEETPGPSRV
jgi:hypothetical protein